MKQTVIRDCKTGLSLDHLTGSIESITMDKLATAVAAVHTSAQLTSVLFDRLDPNGSSFSLDHSALTLLNCNLKPDHLLQVNIVAPPDSTNAVPIETFQYLVVAVKGSVPPRAQVEVKSTKTPEGLTADLNARNSPAAVRSSGLTPLPQTLACLVVKAFGVSSAKKTIPAPEYIVRVLEPASSKDGQPNMLASRTVTPDDSWYRPKPNDPVPTIEITLP